MKLSKRIEEEKKNTKIIRKICSCRDYNDGLKYIYELKRTRMVISGNRWRFIMQTDMRASIEHVKYAHHHLIIISVVLKFYFTVLSWVFEVLNLDMEHTLRSHPYAKNTVTFFRAISIRKTVNGFSASESFFESAVWSALVPWNDGRLNFVLLLLKIAMCVRVVSGGKWFYPWFRHEIAVAYTEYR